MLGDVVFELGLTFSHQCKKKTFMMNNLLSSFRPSENPLRFSGRSVNVLYRTCDAPSHKETVSINNKTARQLTGATLQRPKLAMPLGNWSFPEHGAIEGVSRNQLPAGRKLNRNPRALVHDIKHSSSSRDKGAHRSHPVMMP